MKKLILTTIFLILANTIYADGIIENLEQYLQRYPKRIDEGGWVTIPAGELMQNGKVFDKNSQYQLVCENGIVSYAINVTAYHLTFKWSINGYLVRIAHNKK